MGWGDPTAIGLTGATAPSRAAAPEGSHCDAGFSAATTALWRPCTGRGREKRDPARNEIQIHRTATVRHRKTCVGGFGTSFSPSGEIWKVLQPTGVIPPSFPPGPSDDGAVCAVCGSHRESELKNMHLAICETSRRCCERGNVAPLGNGEMTNQQGGQSERGRMYMWWQRTRIGDGRGGEGKGRRG